MLNHSLLPLDPTISITVRANIKRAASDTCRYISQQNISSLELVNGSYLHHIMMTCFCDHVVRSRSILTTSLVTWSQIPRHVQFKSPKISKQDQNWKLDMIDTNRHFKYYVFVEKYLYCWHWQFDFARHGLFKNILNWHFKLLARSWLSQKLFVFVCFSLSTNICCWEGDNIKSTLIQNSNSPLPSNRNIFEI